MLYKSGRELYEGRPVLQLNGLSGDAAPRLASETS